MTVPVATAGAWVPSGLGTQVLELSVRSLRPFVHSPRLLLLSLLQPLTMLLLFSQVFGSLATIPGFPPGLDYIDYLLPAIAVVAAVNVGMQSGTGLMDDINNGILARLRTLPIRLAAVPLARSLSATVRTVPQLLVMLVVGLVVLGFDPAGGPAGLLAGLAVALLAGWSVAWVFMCVAGRTRSVETLQMVNFLALVPLSFGSSAYVPVGSLPGWLQAFARVNPMTYSIDAARGFALGDVDLVDVLAAVSIWPTVAAVAALLTVRSLRRS